MFSRTGKIILSVVGLIFLMGGVFVGIILVKQNQEIRKDAYQAGGIVELKLSSPDTTLAPGESTQVSLVLNTHNTEIKGVTAKIVLPLTPVVYVTNPTPNASLFIPNDQWHVNSFTTTDTATQKEINIIASYQSASNSYTTNSDVTFATFTLTAPQTDGNVTLSFDEANSVINSNTNEDVLGTLSGITFTIGGGTTEPSPTATITQAAEPTATITQGTQPASSPTPSHTPTPTNSTQAATSPTPSPTLVPPGICNVSCTSNSNCTGGLVCESGQCRNSTCRSDGDCNCDAPSGTSISITSPLSGAALTTLRPVFKGTAAPNARITVTINSAPVVTGSTTANASGAWTFTPTQNLAAGSHTATFVAYDSQNRQTTATVSFTVRGASGAGGSAGTTNVATDSATLPLSGNFTPTLAMLLAGLLMMLGGSYTLTRRKI